MKYLLDTNACVQILRAKGHPLVKQRFAACRPADIALCAVVVGELLLGAEKSADPAAGRQQVDAFAAPYPCLPFDEDAARLYAVIRHDLESRGLPIGENDYLIAAIARLHNLTLVTHNTGEFSRVPGLALEDWEIP